jgi:hypothetical protein
VQADLDLPRTWTGGGDVKAKPVVIVKRTRPNALDVKVMGWMNLVRVVLAGGGATFYFLHLDRLF